ncbi:MAG: hypothetical protein AAF518_16350 [Spirochaetota bacterium]
MQDIYTEVKQYFQKVQEVEVNSGKGAQGIKYNKKMFAMFYKGELTVKLSPKRVTELIASGDGLPHDPGTGKAMKDRVLIPQKNKKLWIQYCKESLQYMQASGK